MAFQNLPTYILDAAVVVTRNAEYAFSDPFTDLPGDDTYDGPVQGCNKAGSCAPGIGIATAVIDPSGPGTAPAGQLAVAWTLLDQGAGVDGQPTPLARIAQVSQHIGGLPLGTIAQRPSSGGSEALTDTTVINAVLAFDNLDDTVSFIAAVVQAAVGAGYNTAAADPTNRAGRTIEIGERLWGTNTV